MLPRTALTPGPSPSRGRGENFGGLTPNLGRGEGAKLESEGRVRTSGEGEEKRVEVVG